MTGWTSSRDQSGSYFYRTGPYPVRGGPVPVGGGSRGRREAVGDPSPLSGTRAGKGLKRAMWAVGPLVSEWGGVGVSELGPLVATQVDLFGPQVDLLGPQADLFGPQVDFV